MLDIVMTWQNEAYISRVVITDVYRVFVKDFAKFVPLMEMFIN